MKKFEKFLLAFAFISLSVASYADFPTWKNQLTAELRNKVLQNNYARRLLFPKKDRITTGSYVAPENAINLFNIHDGQDLWTAKIRIDQISRAEIMNIPIAPGAFHFATLFHFKNGIKMQNAQNQEKTINGILMGTGPEKDFSIQGIAGMQLIQMRAYSIESYESVSPIDKKYRHQVNPKKVDIALFFLAHAEESARLEAMTHLRALRAEEPEMADEIIFQKYNVFGANCVSSGIQNLARAIKSEFHQQILSLGRNDISEMASMTQAQFRYWIKSWNEVDIQALRAILGKAPDQAKFKELEVFHRHLIKTNRMSLPWRAKAIIDWATSQ